MSAQANENAAPMAKRTAASNIKAGILASVTFSKSDYDGSTAGVCQRRVSRKLEPPGGALKPARGNPDSLGVFPEHTTPERMLEIVKAEGPPMGKLLRAAGIKAQ